MGYFIFLCVTTRIGGFLLDSQPVSSIFDQFEQVKREQVNSLGEKLRDLRESQGLLLRQAAAFVEVDTAFLSKVERGEKKASRNQVIKLANFLNADEQQLLVFWLCDKIIATIDKDPLGELALELALKKSTGNK